MFNRELGRIEVEIDLGPQVRFQALQNQPLLVRSPIRVVVNAGDAFADTIVVGPPLVPGQLPTQRYVNRLAVGKVADHCNEEPVQDVRRYINDVAPDDEGLDGFETRLSLHRGGAAGVDFGIDVQ